MTDTPQIDTVALATELTIAWLSNSNTRVGVEDVPGFLRTMHDALSGLSTVEEPPEAIPEFVPAVSVRKSLASKEHIISLIDGKAYRTLRRHLSRHGLTPEQYRERYNLKADYPVVAEAYSKARSDMARQNGLGRKVGEKRPMAAAPKPRGRPKKSG